MIQNMPFDIFIYTSVLRIKKNRHIVNEEHEHNLSHYDFDKNNLD